MSLAALFIVITAIMVFRDRRDWINYVFISVGMLYLGQTDPGRAATGWLNGAGKWIDQVLRNFLPGLQ